MQGNKRKKFFVNEWNKMSYNTIFEEGGGYELRSPRTKEAEEESKEKKEIV